MPIAALRTITSRTARTASLALIGALYVLLLIYEALQADRLAPPRTHDAMWAWYATYALSGALFFGVGALVWLYGYARQRTVAALLFWFCNLVMLAFGSLSGATLGDNFSNALGASTSALAVLCLFLLLLRFPRNLLPQRTGRCRVMALVQVVTGLLSLISASSSILNDVFSWTPPRWWYLLGGFYYGIVGLLTVLIIVLAARTSPSIRALQQTRLFFAGTLLSFVPILLVTVIPTVLHLEASIDGTRSMVFLVFFPAAVSYSLLRYELLVFDIYVRRVVTRVIGGVGIALLGYLLFATSSQLLGGNAPLLLAGMVGAGVLLAPYVWWLARRLTERFFFPETAFYATRLKEAHARQGLETFDLLLAGHQLVLDVITTLQSPEACIFVLDEEAQNFRMLALPQRETRSESALADLLAEFGQLLSPAAKETAPGIAEQDPSIALLSSSRRPLFLSEIAEGARARAVGITRYIKSRARGAAPDPLLAPIRTAHGRLIGLVAVGERGDRQLYAGPELEALQHLIDRASSAIETARLYEMATRQQAASRRELELAYEQQRELNSQKDQFIIHVSHELRTPLTEVTGYLDMLAASGEELDPELRAVFVEKAQHGSEVLQRLVEKILEAARSSFASPLPLRMEAVALSATVQEVMDHLDPQAARDHEIEVQIAPSTRVYADAHALQLILSNLVSNALKYTPPGTPICVRATNGEDGDAGVVCVQVKDEGPGIPPSEASTLFGKFARLQRDLSGSIRGTGLGLYITKQLVEAMDGRIWLASSGIEGEGSLFAFTLRQAGAPLAAEHAIESVLA